MSESPQYGNCLNSVSLLPRRLLLATPGVEASVPMLRGAWGAALHDLAPAAYRAVFGTADDGQGPPPGYLLRPAPPDPRCAPAVDFFLIGEAVKHDAACADAWLEAARRGLGPQRRPFAIRRTLLLTPCGKHREEPDVAAPVAQPPSAVSAAQPPSGDARRPGLHGQRDSPPRSVGATLGWPLGDARWPLAADAPCRLVFRAPLRLRRHGRLIEQPTLPDLVVAAGRRIEAFLPDEARADWQALSAAALEQARLTPQSAWRGARLDLHRWSARQQNELDLHGVCGSLALPHGPAALAPLLAAAQWLHLGKATVMGLGQFEVEGPGAGD